MTMTTGQEPNPIRDPRGGEDDYMCLHTGLRMKKIGEVTITGIDEPHGEWPEIVHVRYAYTGTPTEEMILWTIREADCEFAGSSRIFDPRTHSGGYVLTDEDSRLRVGDTLPVFDDPEWAERAIDRKAGI
jgi:hypothetical protein